MNRILLIEDEERIAELIKKSLEEQHYSVTVAWDSISGKKLSVANDHDLIITDIILPGLNGIEVCKGIRLLKPGVPIIMLTALGTTDDKVDGFDAGADDYLVKPFDFRELLARIRALINRSNGKNTVSKPDLLKYADGAQPGLDPLTSPIGEIYRYIIESKNHDLRQITDLQTCRSPRTRKWIKIWIM